MSPHNPAKVFFLPFLILLLTIFQLLWPGPGRAESGNRLRLIFVGSLSGYVKLCG